jgi:hypothetical protein
MIHYKENIDYVEVNSLAGIKILSEEFSGVIFTYSDVSMSDVEENLDSPAVLSFSFTLVDKGNYTDEEFQTIEFKDKLGDILMSILLNSLEK